MSEGASTELRLQRAYLEAAEEEWGERRYGLPVPAEKVREKLGLPRESFTALIEDLEEQAPGRLQASWLRGQPYTITVFAPLAEEEINSKST